MPLNHFEFKINYISADPLISAIEADIFFLLVIKKDIFVSEIQ